MVSVKMLIEIDPLPMRGSLVMTMVMISPSRREVSPAKQLRQSPRLVPPRFRLVAAESHPERWLLIFSPRKQIYGVGVGGEGPPGGPRGRGARPGGVARPHPRGQGVGPLTLILSPIFLYFPKVISVDLQVIPRTVVSAQ